MHLTVVRCMFIVTCWGIVYILQLNVLFELKTQNFTRSTNKASRLKSKTEPISPSKHYYENHFFLNLASDPRKFLPQLTVRSESHYTFVTFIIWILWMLSCPFLFLLFSMAIHGYFSIFYLPYSKSPCAASGAVILNIKKSCILLFLLCARRSRWRANLARMRRQWNMWKVTENGGIRREREREKN